MAAAPLQVNLSNTLTAIPTPTACQSNFGTTLDGRLVQFVPGFGWFTPEGTSGGGGTTADGSETKVTAGSNVTSITGTGTTANPYVINVGTVGIAAEPTAQINLNVDPSAIPAPTGLESNWGVNTLNETLRYIVGVGWRPIANLIFFEAAGTVAGNAGFGVIAQTLVMPRAGRVLFSVSALATADTTPPPGGGVDYLNVRFNVGGGRRIIDGGALSVAQTVVASASGVAPVLLGDTVTMQIDNGCAGVAEYTISYQYMP